MEKIDSYINRRRIETWKARKLILLMNCRQISEKFDRIILGYSKQFQQTLLSVVFIIFVTYPFYCICVILSKFRGKKETCCIYFMFSRLLLNASSVNMFISILLFFFCDKLL